MSGDEHAATVYAGALFAAAHDADAIEDVRADLHAFAAAFATSPDLRRALFDPMIDKARKQQVVTTLTAGGSPLVANTVHLLLEKGRLGILGALAKDYERLAERAADLVEIEVSSAIPLPEAAEHELMQRLQAATGRRVRLVKRVDESVLGGLFLRVGEDIVVDASVRARMELLRDRLTGVGTRGASE